MHAHYKDAAVEEVTSSQFMVLLALVVNTLLRSEGRELRCLQKKSKILNLLWVRWTWKNGF